MDVISKLDHFMREFRDVERGRSVSSSQMEERPSAVSWPTWPTVQKKLEEIGISAAAFEANKNLIFSWFTGVTADKTVQAGHLEDASKRLPRNISSSRSVEDLGTYSLSRSDGSRFVPIQRFRSEDCASTSVKSHQPRVSALLSPNAIHRASSAQNTQIPDQHVRSKSFDSRLSTRSVYAQKMNVSLGTLFAARQRLLEAAEEGSWSKVSKIVDDEFELVLMDQLTLDLALRIAAMRRNGPIAKLLVKRGAHFNTCSPKGSSALDYALEEGNEKVLQVFLDEGANTED